MFDVNLVEMIQELPPELQEEVKDFVAFLLERRVQKSKRSHLRQDWAGGLKAFRDQYTSLELQRKAVEEWRGD